MHQNDVVPYCVCCQPVPASPSVLSSRRWTCICSSSNNPSPQVLLTHISSKLQNFDVSGEDNYANCKNNHPESTHRSFAACSTNVDVASSMKSIVIVSPTARTPHADKPIDVLVKPSSEIAVSMIRSSATEHVACPWAEDGEEAKQVVKSRTWLTKEGTTCIIRFRRKAHCQIQPIGQPCAGSSPLARLCPRQSRQFEDYCGTPRQSHQLHCNIRTYGALVQCSCCQSWSMCQ